MQHLYTVSIHRISTLVSTTVTTMGSRKTTKASTFGAGDASNSTADTVHGLRHQLRQVEMKNRILRSQLSQMRLTNGRYYQQLEACRSEANRRHQYLGELLVKYFSCMCIWYIHDIPCPDPTSLAMPFTESDAGDLDLMNTLFQNLQVIPWVSLWDVTYTIH